MEGIPRPRRRYRPLWGILIGFGLLMGCAGREPPPSLTPTAGVPSLETLPGLTVAPPSPTPTLPSATPTPTWPPTPLPTSTPTPCAGPVCVEAGHFVLDWPVEPPEPAVMAYYAFGGTARGRRDPHRGLDLPAAFGTPVRAAAGGEVVFAGADAAQPLAYWPNYYGQAVVIRHTFPGLRQPVYTLYGHLETLAVQVGQTVNPGDTLGTVGSRGVATGPHLHLEVRWGENSYDAVQNPALWLKPLPGRGALALRIADPQGQPLYLTNVTLEALEGQAPTLYLETYADPALRGDPQWHENQAVVNLPEGPYRLAVVALGCPHELRLTVEAGRLTVVNWTLTPCP